MVGEIGIELSEVLDQLEPRSVVGDRLEENKGVVLADIVISKGFLVGVVEALETRVRHGLLVFRPGDAFGVKEIHDCGNVVRYRVEVVIVHAEVVTRNNGTVIGL